MARSKNTEMNHSADSITFPFQDIVRSEIEAAVEMLVNHQNIVATHLLTQAAHDLMRANASTKNVRLDADLQQVFREVVPKFAKDAIDSHKWAYNGFKHYKSEVEGNITVSPRHVMIGLWLCIGDFVKSFGSVTDMMQLYFRWYVASKSDGGDWLPEDVGRFPSAPLDIPLNRRLAEAKIELAKINAFTESLRP